MFRDELDLAEYDFDPIYWQDREKLKERVSIRYSVLPKPGPGCVDWPEAVYETVYRVNIPFSIILTTSTGEKREVSNNIHILQEDADKNVYYIVNKRTKDKIIGDRLTYEEAILITGINTVPIKSANKGMELIRYASKLKNRLKTLAHISIYR